MRPSSISLPEHGVLIVAPNGSAFVDVPATGRPFKITGAERVEGIDYEAFACPGMFAGSINCPAPPNDPWPLARMFSGFSWPGGQMLYSGASVPFLGEAPFHFLVINTRSEPMPFAIRLTGLEMS